ncbi:MAG: hypothetical protein CMLOHMNK_02622 [Steroidobacteraceae bacterium]|nr:hypothetical protein [Steroidobacteraceae bacterium]
MKWTADLELLALLPAHKEAFHRGREHLAALLAVAIPDGWPQFPEAFDLPAPSGIPALPDLTNAEWPAYLFIWRGGSTLVGSGGFAGPPDTGGVVEIGYEIAPTLRNRGLATRAAETMLKSAFRHPQVRAVVAHTLAEENASNAVLRKVGMVFVGELPNTEVGKVWRWELRRQDQ